MQPTERIEVRKLYIGSAVKFGLLYGLIIGLIIAIVSLISGALGYRIDSILTDLLPFSGLLVVSLIILFSFIIIGVIGMIIIALIYNLVSSLGSGLHIGLAEYQKPIKPTKAVKPDKSMKAIPNKSTKTSNLKVAVK